jgi:hypothetical protein
MIASSAPSAVAACALQKCKITEKPMTAEELGERIARAEMRAARLHVAVVKAIDDLCILIGAFQISAQTHDEEHVTNVKAKHVRAAMKVAKNLAAAIAQEKSKD